MIRPPHYSDNPNIIGGPSLGELMRYYDHPAWLTYKIKFKLGH